MASNFMDSSKVVPMEDLVQALVDYLVDPVLPLKSSTCDALSLSQQQRVAKQMHAVVILYNYYHRRQFSKLEFLSFKSFCKVAVNAKPNLLMHMKFMQGCNFGECDQDQQLSITENVIMDACNICIDLDASKDDPSIDGWPISKITVFLVDIMKNNCFLSFGSITEGIWSLIERDLDDFNTPADGVLERKDSNKRKRITKGSLRDELSVESGFRQLAFSAVKERTDIDQTDLMVLESHVVYSITKRKTAACFYLMQCTKPHEDIIQVPIKDAINSLQGPLVKKISSTYTITPAVEFFHLLPYAGILSEWLSREENPIKPSLLQLLDSGNVNIGSSPSAQKPSSTEVNGCSYTSKRTIVTSHRTDGKTSEKIQEIQDQKEIDQENTFPRKILANHLEGKSTAAGEDDLDFTGSSSKFKVELLDPVVKPCVKGNVGVKDAEENDTLNFGLRGCDATPMADHQRALKSDGLEPEKVLNIMASKGDDLLQTALKLLQKKRGDLSQQQRELEDEIARCENTLQTILSGCKGDLISKIESIMEACSVACSRGITQTYTVTQLHIENQSSPLSLNRKRLSEAILTSQDSCQELDSICHQNNWILPRYSVFPSDGGYRATVTVKGIDFDCPCSGDIQANPSAARASAASNVLTTLRCMAGQVQ